MSPSPPHTPYQCSTHSSFYWPLSDVVQSALHGPWYSVYTSSERHFDVLLSHDLMCCPDCHHHQLCALTMSYLTDIEPLLSASMQGNLLKGSMGCSTSSKAGAFGISAEQCSLENAHELPVLLQNGEAADRQSKEASSSGNSSAAAPAGKVTVTYWYRCATQYRHQHWTCVCTSQQDRQCSRYSWHIQRCSAAFQCASLQDSNRALQSPPWLCLGAAAAAAAAVVCNVADYQSCFVRVLLW